MERSATREEGYSGSGAGLPGLALFLLVGLAYAAGSLTSYAWFNAGGVGATFFPGGGGDAGGIGVGFAAALGVLPRRGCLRRGDDRPDPRARVRGQLRLRVRQHRRGLLGAILVRRFASQLPPNLSLGRDLLAFLAGAVVIGPTLGGVLGATNYVVVGGGEGWFDFMLEWLIGDGLGVLVIGSTILSILPMLRRRDAGPLASPSAVVLVVLAAGDDRGGVLAARAAARLRRHRPAGLGCALGRHSGSDARRLRRLAAGRAGRRQRPRLLRGPRSRPRNRPRLPAAAARLPDLRRPRPRRRGLRARPQPRGLGALGVGSGPDRAAAAVGGPDGRRGDPRPGRDRRRRGDDRAARLPERHPGGVRCPGAAAGRRRGQSDRLRGRDQPRLRQRRSASDRRRLPPWGNAVVPLPHGRSASFPRPRRPGQRLRIRARRAAGRRWRDDRGDRLGIHGRRTPSTPPPSPLPRRSPPSARWPCSGRASPRSTRPSPARRSG